MAFGGSIFGSKTTATTTATPTPKPTPAAKRLDVALPTVDEQAFQYETTPVVYNAGSSYGAPDPGRNIFAFYEPPPPTPYVPPPPTPEVIKPASPTPPPPMLINFANPQSVFAGSRGFRLELNGERFAPDARIYFNQTELPTTFINGEKLISDIPSNLIAQEGPRQIIAQTPDGKLYSNQFILTVQAPPKPGLQYIGMIGRKRYNNDTAYFLENGKTTPFGARLNDIISGRFRLVDISPVEVVFEDINLGFRHPVPISKAATTGTGTGQPTRGNPMDGFPQFDPGMQKGNPPGIPGNIQPYVPPVQKGRPNEKEQKDDVDDDGED